MSCPYNSNHRFAKEKLHNHLLRCKERQKSKKKLYHCYANNMVVFFKEEKLIHEQSCPYCNRSLLPQGINNSTLLDITQPEQSSLMSEISLISSTPAQTTNKHKANTNVESPQNNNNNNVVVNITEQSQSQNITLNHYHNFQHENNSQSFINQEHSTIF